MEFEVGNRVRIISYSVYQGRVGRILEKYDQKLEYLRPTRTYQVILPQEKPMSFGEEELELVVLCPKCDTYPIGKTDYLCSYCRYGISRRLMYSAVKGRISELGRA